MLGTISHLIKEMLELVRRSVLRAKIKPSKQAAVIREHLQSNGYYVINDYWPQEKCAEARAEIDALLFDVKTTKKWADDHGSDTRFFYAEQMGGVYLDFLNDELIEEARLCHSGRVNAEKAIMAAKLVPREGNHGSGGGWHRDSPHTPQFKALIYLTDVNKDNGPFEYIAGSQKSSRSIIDLIKGYARPNQYRFTNSEIKGIKNTVTLSKVFTGKAGTLVIFDSKGVHRGVPIEAGERYAITLYCSDGGPLLLY